MLSCENCHVKIRGNKTACPLCGGELQGKPEDPAFPVIPKRKYTSRMVLKITLFIIIAIIVVCLTLRYLLGPSSYGWTGAVMLWSPFGLVGVAVTMTYRSNVQKLILAEGYIAMALNILIDIKTGFGGWSFAFVVPSLFLVMILGTMISGLVLRYRLSDYLVYLLTVQVMSFLQLVFVRLGLNPHPGYSVVVAAASVLMVFGELIFMFQEVRSTTAKALHL